MQFVQPTPFYEAIDKLGSESPIGSILTSSEWSDLPVALREHAFFSSQVENVRFLQRARSAIDDYLRGARVPSESGELMLATGSRAQFVDQMRAFALREGMGPLDPDDVGGLKDITSEARLGLIFDTKTQQAADYGYWRQGMHADVLNEFPAQRFIRVKAVKQERASHMKFEDQVYLKTDPIWANVINEDFGVPWGPWAWGCGHDVEDVDWEEAVSLGLISPKQRLQPDVKSFNENLQASIKTLDPDLLQKISNVFGQRAVVENDVMRWRSDEEMPTVSQPSVVSRENESPVSDAIELKVSGTLRESASTAIAAIDKVHDDGALPVIPLRNTRLPYFGFLHPVQSADGITAEYIAVRGTGPWPALTAVHETGHFLDLEAIGEKGNLATRAGNADMLSVLAAAEKTGAVQGLREQFDASRSLDVRKHLAYLLKPEEIWARAYAQFIAEKSGNRTLARDLANALGAEKFRQWTADDFAPVADAIETMFKKFGWL